MGMYLKELVSRYMHVKIEHLWDQLQAYMLVIQYYIVLL